MRAQPLNIFSRLAGNAASRDGYGGTSSKQALIPDTVDEERASNAVGVLGDFKTKNNPLSVLYSRGFKKQSWNSLENFQRGVHRDCVRKAYAADTKYNNYQPRRPMYEPNSNKSRPSSQAGPIQKECMRLGPIEGYIVGVFGGISSHLNSLLRRIAHTAAERDFHDMGFEKPSYAFAAILQHCYRVVGVAAQRSYARLKARVVQEVYHSRAQAAQISMHRRQRAALSREREVIYARMAANIPSVTATWRRAHPVWGMFGN